MSLRRHTGRFKGCTLSTGDDGIRRENDLQEHNR
jgi:hypothetical protein